MKKSIKTLKYFQTERFSIVPQEFIKFFKDLELSYYLSRLISLSIYYQEKSKNQRDDWFYINAEKLNEQMPFFSKNNRKRTSFDKKLEELEIIETKFEGLPRRKYYRINSKNLELIIDIVNDPSSYTNRRRLVSPWRCNYICIYNNKLFTNVNSYGNFVSVNDSSSKRRTPEVKKKLRKIKRRPIDPRSSEIISYWSSLGDPFAKVRKLESLVPIVRKLLKSNKNNVEEIKRVIDIGFDYMSRRREFKFKMKNNISMKHFFVRSNYTVGDEFLRDNQLKSWFDAFQLKSDNWLQENLLNSAVPKDPDLHRFLHTKLEVRNGNFEDNQALIIGANKMLEFMKANDFPERTMLFDFENFINHNYPDSRKFKLYWLKSSNFWNRRFSNFLVDFGRFDSIDKIKEI